jgi:hypothetical protein
MCFEQRSGYNVGLDQESNQRAVGSPRPDSTSCKIPITPQEMELGWSGTGSVDTTMSQTTMY